VGANDSGATFRLVGPKKASQFKLSDCSRKSTYISVFVDVITFKGVWLSEVRNEGKMLQFECSRNRL